MYLVVIELVDILEEVFGKLHLYDNNDFANEILSDDIVSSIH